MSKEEKYEKKMRNSETLMWNEQAIDSLKSQLSSLKEQADKLEGALEKLKNGPRLDSKSLEYVKEILSTYKQSKG